MNTNQPQPTKGQRLLSLMQQSKPIMAQMRALFPNGDLRERLPRENYPRFQQLEQQLERIDAEIHSLLS